MQKFWHIFAVFIICFVQQRTAQNDLTPEEQQELFKEGEKKMSEHILEIIEHYKQEDPVGVPGVPIPEPLDIPPLKQSFSVATMNFKNVKLYGLSKFRIDHIESDLAAMQVKAGLRIKTLDVFGNYTLSSWFSKSQGPFTVKLSNVYVEGIAKLEVEKDGKLKAQEMKMDITFENIAMNFENLGFAGSVFQGIINSVGTFLFDSIKPFILSEINNNIRGDINKQISTLPQTFPNSISPFDQIVAEGRKVVRERKYDPYYVPDYNHTIGLFNVYMTHTWLTGLSSFYRVGNVTFEIRNHTLSAGVDVGTQKLEGKSHWEITIGGGMISRAGTLSFTIDYFNVQTVLSQTLDTRNHPVLEDIQLEMGNIQVRCNGAGTIDYIIEFGVNVFPNLLRYQIMDAIESPIKKYIQEQLNRVNVEEVIKEKLPEIDAAKDGFKF